MKIKKDNPSILLSILVFLILFSPVRNQLAKLILILLILGIVIFQLRNNKLMISNKIVYWFLLYLVLNTFFLSIGGFKNADIIGQLAPLKIIWPILYFFSFVCFTSIKKVNVNLDKVFFVLSMVIPLFLLVTFYLDSLPAFLSIFFPYTKTYYAGFVDYFSPAITSLFFLGTYSISRVISNNEGKFSKFIIPTLIILWTSFIIGRRALLVLIFLSPIIYLFLQLVTKKIKIQLFLKMLFITLLMILLVYFILIFNNTDLRILEVIKGNDVFLDNARSSQFLSLIKGWGQNPILGAGFGMNADVVRSSSYLGAYELSYVALLFQTGLIGLLLYLSLYIWIIVKLISIYKKTESSYVLSFCIGAIAIFLANFSNPYIDSFDGLWFIFLGLSIINKYLVEEREKNEDFDTHGNI